MVLVLLPGRSDDVGKAVVHPHEAAARDVRQDAVKNLATLGVLVETRVHEVAQRAPGLRAAPAICLLDAARERVGVAAVVLRLVLQEAREVAHADVAETKHPRVLRRVDELVDPAGLEARRQVDVDVGLDDRPLGPLVV